HRLPAPGGGAQGAGGPASLSSSASLSAAAPWSAAAAAVPDDPEQRKREQPGRRGARRRGRASFPVPPGGSGAVPVVRQPHQAPLLGRFGQGAPEPAGTPASGADPLRQVTTLHRAFLGRPGEVVDLTVEVPLGGRLRPARSAAGPHHSRRVRLRAPRAGTEAPWPLRLPLTAPGPALPGAAIAFGDQAPVVRRQLSLQFGLPVALLLLRRGGVGLLRGQRTRDVLQRLPFGADTEDQLGEPAQQHGPAPDEEPEGDQV